ncbi:MAG: peroxidase [Blastocatellia bacterium]
MAELNLNDIQGFILRGYRIDVARFFILRINDAGAAKSFLGGLVSGDTAFPQITSAEDWGLTKPDYCLNIGITFEGLTVLQVNASDLASFPQSFKLGATSQTTATAIGDIGDSAPENWTGGLSDGAQVHVVLVLYTHTDQGREEWSTVLRALFNQYSLIELSAHDTAPLPNGKIHFGYTDGISQPHVDGAPTKAEIPDDQPVAPTGEFLMGYTSQNPGQIYNVSPADLSLNSSFAAFRILKQDVVAFDAFLDQVATEYNIDKELFAAKLCGRWRNGIPLILSPDTQYPNPPIPPKLINCYDYVSSGSATEEECLPAADDTFGFSCPIGAHMRRNNPRSELVTGSAGEGHLHRIMRRAIPYGPEYDPANPDTVERGLIGMFINVDLANQFEFLISQWCDTSSFVKSVRGPNGVNPVNNISGQDIFLGVNDESASSFTLSTPTGNQKITGFGRFVITRGGAYCYLPSITAMKYLAGLPTQ